MSNVWFIGDIHGGHRNVHKFRKQFQSEEDHFQHVKDNFHKVVKKRDKVFFMGDTAFTLERLQDISTWVCGRKVLICGNHDTDHIPMKVLCEYFDEVYSLYKWHEFWLSHCPIHPDELRGKVNIHGHCVDTQTEILTTDGWKLRNELKYTDILYSFDDANKKVVAKSIDEIVDINYTGKAYTFKTKSVNQRVTEGHTMVGLSTKGAYKKLLAKELALKSSFIYILNGELMTNGINLTDDELRLYVAINADGNVNLKTNLVRFKLKKDGKKEFIRGILNNLEVEFSEYTYDNGSSCINFKLPSTLKDWKLKGLDVKLRGVTKDQFKVILDTYSKTDGTRYKTYSTVYTSKKEEVDLLSELATLNGFTSTTSSRVCHGFSKKESYEMYFREHNTSHSNRVRASTVVEDVENEHFWCVRTELQNFFIKRNGKVSLTGNCHYATLNDKRYYNTSLENTGFYPVDLNFIRSEMVLFNCE